MRRLIRLLASNDAARLPKIVRGYDPDWDGDEDAPDVPVDVAGDAATIYFYGVIGGWDQPETEDIVRAIAALNVATIHMRINSPGGLVFDSVAIKTALEQNPANVVCHVDGLAASAASTLMLAADTIEIAAGGFVMIHNPATIAMGDADEMRATASMLDAIRDSIVGQYAARTGMKPDALAAMMSAETWLSADQAVAQKFCDSVAVKAPAPENLKRFDLSAWANAPAALKAPPAKPNIVDLTALAASRSRAESRMRLIELNA